MRMDTYNNILTEVAGQRTGKRSAFDYVMDGVAERPPHLNTARYSC